LHPADTGKNSVKFPFPPQTEKTVEIAICDASETMERLQLHAIDILKIDTEGCEVEILESLQSMLDGRGNGNSRIPQ